MPRNRSSNLVFIHIPKNAGKYVEDRFGLSFRSGSEANQLNRSLLSNLARALIKLDTKRQSFAKNSLTGMIDVGLVAQHLTLVEMQLYGFLPPQLDDYNIFATVRNPYTRMKSIYMHMTTPRERSQEDFENFAKNWPVNVSPNMRHNILAFKRKQVDFLRDINGNITTEVYVAKVENLEEDLVAYERQLNSPNLSCKSKFLARPSTAKQHQVPRHGLDAKETIFISQAVKNRVYQNYTEDFDLLGYPKD